MIKEFAFVVYSGMLYSLCILQGYKTSLILNITPKVISEKSLCEIKLDFKNHRDKQLWNTTGLIRFLVYLTTWQTSYPSPLPQKTSHENQAGDKDSSLMQFRGKGKARTFFGKHPATAIFVWLLCFMDSILLPWRASCSEREPCSPATWVWRSSTINFCFPLLVPTALQQRIIQPAHPVQCLWDWLIQPPLKRQCQMQLRNNYYMMTQKRLREENRISETDR